MGCIECQCQCILSPPDVRGGSWLAALLPSLLLVPSLHCSLLLGSPLPAGPHQRGARRQRLHLAPDGDERWRGEHRAAGCQLLPAVGAAREPAPVDSNACCTVPPACLQVRERLCCIMLFVKDLHASLRWYTGALTRARVAECTHLLPWRLIQRSSCPCYW